MSIPSHRPCSCQGASAGSAGEGMRKRMNKLGTTKNAKVCKGWWFLDTSCVLFRYSSDWVALTQMIVAYLWGGGKSHEKSCSLPWKCQWEKNTLLILITFAAAARGHLLCHSHSRNLLDVFWEHWTSKTDFRFRRSYGPKNLEHPNRWKKTLSKHGGVQYLRGGIRPNQLVNIVFFRAQQIANSIYFIDSLHDTIPPTNISISQHILQYIPSKSPVHIPNHIVYSWITYIYIYTLNMKNYNTFYITYILIYCLYIIVPWLYPYTTHPFLMWIQAPATRSRRPLGMEAAHGYTVSYYEW